MDRLEAYKTENAHNDAVVDDVAAKAYMENFALETFNRADDAQRNNKVTRQTADTFQASATFMDVLSIWGALDPDIAAKSKFAKFHALRIAKAIKAGEDPNATNTVVEQPQPNDLGDASVEASLEAELKSMENGGGYKPPTVETAPDSARPSRPQSTLATTPPFAAQTSSSLVGADVSPIDPSGRIGSIGGGYFPSVPDAPGNTTPSPTAPANFTPSDPADFYNHQASSLFAPPPPQGPAFGQTTPQPRAPQSVPTTYSSQPPSGSYKDDDESIMAAQKHAKWAISALNFEDVQTAVQELRIALQCLGA
jgi:vacuolar protein sorting-associated protein VTA1